MPSPFTQIASAGSRALDYVCARPVLYSAFRGPALGVIGVGSFFVGGVIGVCAVEGCFRLAKAFRERRDELRQVRENNKHIVSIR